ncbi:MAG: PatB family C-S lyase [Negativicutes bacterium]|nr:PatB family C-S lyase [Negativicutes bacterium]
MYDFDRIIERRGTCCSQWDYAENRFAEEGVLPFAVSDMDFACPGSVLDAIRRRLDHPVLGYTRWQNCYYRDAVADWWQKRFDLEVMPEDVVYTPGILATIAMLLDIWTEPGEGVIIQPPVYDSFHRLIAAHDRRVVENPLILENDWYSIDWRGLENIAASGQAGVLLLCSPHTPVGRVWSRAELDRLVDICHEYRLRLISDEAHLDLVYRDHRPVSLLAAAGHRPVGQQVAVISSAAKPFNLSGVNSAYAILPHAGLREEMTKRLRKYGVYAANALAMTAVVAAYRHGQPWLAAMLDYIEDNRRWLADYLASGTEGLSLMPAGATYLPWLDCRRLFAGWGYPPNRLIEATIGLARRLADDGKVVTRAGTAFGRGGQGFIRLNIACPRDKLRLAARRIREVAAAGRPV